MDTLVKLGEFAAVLALVSIFSAPFYAVLSLPGVGLCFLVKKYVAGPFWPRAILMSVLVAGLLSPVLVPGHSPMILPFPFGLWLVLHMGNAHAISIALCCAGATLMALFFQSWRYWRRERAGVPARGLIEHLWRGRPTRG